MVTNPTNKNKEGCTMKQNIRIGLLGCALASALGAATAVAQERFVTIGTGGQTGVYYTAGQSVCRFLNRAEAQPPIKCNAPSTAGSVTNIVSLEKGEYEFGFIQSDHQHKALNGLAPFDKGGPIEELRAVFSLQTEILTVVARSDSGIGSFDDLKGKRVNIGVPGSGSRDTFDEVMKAKGWTNADFGLAGELKPAEMASALGDNNLDAITYVVGHPSGAIQEALTNVKAELIPVSGPEIEKFLQGADYYTTAEIPAGLYPGVDKAVPSIGGKAVLATTANTDAEVVYQLVKAVFDNLDRFKRLHPAFADLEAENMIRVGLTAPLHEGAERFYKEKGWL
jgi:TRAP transporter TAXI family solute receptor